MLLHCYLALKQWRKSTPRLVQLHPGWSMQQLQSLLGIAYNEAVCMIVTWPGIQAVTGTHLP